MPDKLAARALLGAAHNHEAHGVEEEEYEHGHEPDDTQALRIAAIFVILVAGLLGALPPLIFKLLRDPNSLGTRLVRSFSAGVILALALVHIIPEAVLEMLSLEGAEDYPHLGGACVLFGAVLMVFLEHLAHSVHDHHQHGTPDVEAQAKAPPVRTSTSGSKPSAVTPIDAGHGHDAQHAHTCVSRGSASDMFTAGATASEPHGTFRLKVIAYMFELGCIFHSFIIGITLGVNQTDASEVRALLIALAFHQWLEGISLASVINRTGFPLWKGIAMIVAYSLTCPVGIAVGMGIAETYDPESTQTRAVQGTFNGVSGGMLLYISLVQLVAEDMSRFVPGRDSTATRLLCGGALALGGASMCILGIWA